MMTEAPPPRPPPLWIVEGVVAYVKDAKNGRLHVATIKSDPFIENGKYCVKIKWDSGRGLVSVDCSLCDSPLVDDYSVKCNATPRSSVVESSAMMNQTQRVARNNYRENDASDDISETAEAPSPALWIRKGDVIMALGGKKETYSAKVLSDPYLDGSSCKVCIKWIDARYTQVVDCRDCLPLEVVVNGDDEEGAPRAKRFRRTNKTEGNAHAIPTHTKKSIATYDDSNENGEDRAFLNAVTIADDVCVMSERELVKKSLVAGLPGNHSPELIEKALDFVGPPYGQNDIMEYLNSAVPMTNAVWWEEPNHFSVEIGMTVRRIHEANKKPAFGTVMEKVKDKVENAEQELVQVWRVSYPDGDSEELEEWQLRLYRYPGPILPPCLGRKFNCLELFAGSCMVSEQFREHQWNFESVDCNPNSNVTIISDIRNLELQNLSSMPDFIWASFPCVTFSKLNGKKDREAGNWAKTPRAREHDDYILKAFAIMKEVRKHHEHLIVAIENPVGKLRTTPLMESFIETFGLYEAEVHYCYFGRDEKKPTHIWVNDMELAERLKRCRCKRPFCDGNHIAIRGNCSRYDFSVIPQPLAKMVADYVNAKLILKDIQHTRTIRPSNL